MALSAYFREDPLTHIVSITIGQRPPVVVMGQFVVDKGAFAGFSGERYVGKPGTDPPQSWRLVDQIARIFTAQSFASAGTPAAPVYLLGTTEAEIGTPSQIHYSRDGEHWSVAYDAPVAGDTQSEVNGLVWHPDDAMFYGCSAGATSEGIHIRSEYRIFSSADGIAWSIKEEFIGAFDASDAERHALQDAAETAFKALCTKPANRGGIPDGLQGYNQATKTFIRPEGIRWGIGNGPSSDLAGIVIEVDGSPVTGGAGLPPGVVAVSFAGGVWNAVIRGESDDSNVPIQIYVSADDGRNWTQVFETTGWEPAGIIAGTVPEGTR